MWHRRFLNQGSVQALGLQRSPWNASLVNRVVATATSLNLNQSTTSDTRRFFGSSEQQQQQAPEGGPFRVLVANRGEIVQRIQKTCLQFPHLFETVVVYSTADAKAPFVTEATGPTVCIGPPAASDSYLNVDTILQTIRDTGSHMVHPGYGFLSENAAFATAVTEQAGAIWLGPPPHAVKEMGDKLRSKEVAVEAGVSVVPGFEGVLESVEQALELANNDIGYPVLLKAAAGGGGKGMRICHHDQDLKEAFPMAKSEGKSFFNDDRLLIEKYIENPHHIEFQVLCCRKPLDKGERAKVRNAEAANTLATMTPFPILQDTTTGKPNPEDFQVVVFPERECSIQRRNQKVIEEAPSVVLTEETRQQMVAQVKKLCQTVGYESAGTIEFLVENNPDRKPGEPQNFYFLEMNTRLQVEHPISEAICGVDLVKGMLWVGAGWGLPEEFITEEDMLPYKGHAVEARIYAEDPLRGFLPSTGPLRPYIEPPVGPINLTNGDAEYIRMDSGVANGHNVSAFYDPMLSKAVYYATDRAQAVEGLATALDQYVIEGVHHNARLVNAVLRHPEFQAGNTPTSFLEAHYPEGFQGVDLTTIQEEELAVAVLMIQSHKSPHQSASPKTVVVQLRGLFGKAFKVTLGVEAANVQFISKNLEEEDDGTSRTVFLRAIDDTGATLDYQPRKYLARVALDGVSRFIQVIKEDVTGEVHVQMYGANMPVLVQSLREFELSKHMREPPKVDTSDIVPSPMPGTVISFAVEEGDLVEAGQELCIVEAMKMQNIIRSPRSGVIASLDVAAGSSVSADQIIVRLEPEVDESAEEAA